MQHIGLARLGRDAEVRYLPDGTAVANLSLAVTVYDKDAEHNRGTQWIDASLWGKQAESLAQYMLKGTLHCFTLSDLKIEEYETRSGEYGSKLVARVDRVELGPRQGDAAPSPAPRPAASPRPSSPAPAQKSQPSLDDDDIPF